MHLCAWKPVCSSPAVGCEGAAAEGAIIVLAEKEGGEKGHKKTWSSTDAGQGDTGIALVVGEDTISPVGVLNSVFKING